MRQTGPTCSVGSVTLVTGGPGGLGTGSSIGGLGGWTLGLYAPSQKET